MNMHSSCLLARLASKDVAMFRFLLEAHENLAIFSVLERNPALIKILFTPESRFQLEEALKEIGKTIPIEILPWPFQEK